MALVFVVDDERRQRELYASTLRNAGIEVQELASAELALEKLQEVTPDMIISDVRMPGMNGVTLLRQVRSSHFELPFLLVTAFADIRDAVKALKLGAVDYLEKPIDLDELLAAVEDVLHLDPEIEQNIEWGILGTCNLVTSCAQKHNAVPETPNHPVLSGARPLLCPLVVWHQAHSVAKPALSWFPTPFGLCIRWNAAGPVAVQECAVCTQPLCCSTWQLPQTVCFVSGLR